MIDVMTKEGRIIRIYAEYFSAADVASGVSSTAEETVAHWLRNSGERFLRGPFVNEFKKLKEDKG